MLPTLDVQNKIAQLIAGRHSLVILRGVPGSGKSLIARWLVGQHDFVRVNRDTLRQMLHNDNGGNHSKEQEKITSGVRDDIIRRALAAGKSVVVDDTNLSNKNVNHFVQLCASGHIVEPLDILRIGVKVDLETALWNNTGPNRTCVPDHVIKTMYEQFLKLTDDDFDLVVRGRNG